MSCPLLATRTVFTADSTPSHRFPSQHLTPRFQPHSPSSCLLPVEKQASRGKGKGHKVRTRTVPTGTPWTVPTGLCLIQFSHQWSGDVDPGELHACLHAPPKGGLRRRGPDNLEPSAREAMSLGSLSSVWEHNSYPTTKWKMLLLTL